MITCTRRLTFCAGHRVVGHEGKCRHLHGHNYVVEITCEADRLDGVGRVVDFGVIKREVGGWIDSALDHGFLVWTKDIATIRALAEFYEDEDKGLVQKCYMMDANPTAENIAEMLRERASKLLEGFGVYVVGVVVHETENCSATATRP